MQKKGILGTPMKPLDKLCLILISISAFDSKKKNVEVERYPEYKALCSNTDDGQNTCAKRAVLAIQKNCLALGAF